jgi:Tol biopolymer transport system component
MRRRNPPHVATLVVLLLVVFAGVGGSAPDIASAGGSDRFTGQITWVRETGVKIRNLFFLHPAGRAGWKDGIKGAQYALHSHEQIRVIRGLVQFKVKLGQGQANCETRQSRGSLTVYPSPQVLLDFRGGTSFCSMTGVRNCIRIGLGAQVKPGTSAVRRCSPSSSRSPLSAVVLTTQPTLIEVVVLPRSSVVKVRRGVATVTGKKRAVVVSSNGRAGAQRVVVSTNGNPTSAAPTQLSPADTKTFVQLAANVPPNHDFQPPPPPRLLKQPGHLSTSRGVSFGFAAAAAGTVTSCALFRSRVMVDAFHLCTGSATYSDLSEGSYTFQVRATDAAGNTGKVRTYAFRVDLTPPKVSISGPPSLTTSHDATFTFKANEPATFICTLDHTDEEPCSSPATYGNLDAGRHTLTLEATDQAGNTASPAPYAWTIERPASAPIAFESNRDGNYEIYVINPDGSGETRLTNNPDEDVDPAWAPNGKRLAFESTRDTHTDSDIYTMNADGSGQSKLIANAAIDRDPKWSPFGDQIAFESNRDGNYELYVVNADGSGLSRLTMNAALDSDPAWSPDGTHIAFESNRDGNSEIYVMKADGTDPQRLTTNPAEDSNPVWSPDGTHIAFESDRDGNHEIYAMNADGSNPIRLTTNGARDSDPAWSPDGSRIAFATERDGNLEIYVMNADGSAPGRLTNNPGRDLVPNW